MPEKEEVSVETEQNFGTLQSIGSQCEQLEAIPPIESNIVYITVPSEDISKPSEPIAPPTLAPVESQSNKAISETSNDHIKEQNNAFVEEKVKKLLKPLHVCLRYKDTTSKVLPEKVDFFGKALLGQTSICGFEDTLTNSARTAGYYLHVSILPTTNYEILGVIALFLSIVLLGEIYIDSIPIL